MAEEERLLRYSMNDRPERFFEIIPGGLPRPGPVRATITTSFIGRSPALRVAGQTDRTRETSSLKDPRRSSKRKVLPFCLPAERPAAA